MLKTVKMAVMPSITQLLKQLTLLNERWAKIVEAPEAMALELSTKVKMSPARYR